MSLFHPVVSRRQTATQPQHAPVSVSVSVSAAERDDDDPHFWPDDETPDTQAVAQAQAQAQMDAAANARIAAMTMPPEECPCCARDGLIPHRSHSTSRHCDAHVAQQWLESCVYNTRHSHGAQAIALMQVGDRYYALQDAAVALSLASHERLDVWHAAAHEHNPAHLVRFASIPMAALPVVTARLAGFGRQVVVWDAPSDPADAFYALRAIHSLHPAGISYPPIPQPAPVLPTVPPEQSRTSLAPTWCAVDGKPCRLYPPARWLHREGRRRGAEKVRTR